jgi:hypothetical protein
MLGRVVRLPCQHRRRPALNPGDRLDRIVDGADVFLLEGEGIGRGAPHRFELLGMIVLLMLLVNRL